MTSINCMKKNLRLHQLGREYMIEYGNIPGQEWGFMRFLYVA